MQSVAKKVYMHNLKASVKILVLISTSILHHHSSRYFKEGSRQESCTFKIQIDHSNWMKRQLPVFSHHLSSIDWPFLVCILTGCKLLKKWIFGWLHTILTSFSIVQAFAMQLSLRPLFRERHVFSDDVLASSSSSTKFTVFTHFSLWESFC